MASDESMQQILTKCSRLKIRDYRSPTKNSIDDIENLVLRLECGKKVCYHSFEPFIHIIETMIASIDRNILWKSNEKHSEHYQNLAKMICRLYNCLCQLDIDNATNDRCYSTICSILQWLRDDVDFQITKSMNHDLHSLIYSSIKYYSLICKNQDDFLNDLLSIASKSKTNSLSKLSCFNFYRRRQLSVQESLSIVDYSSRLVIYLIESSLATSSLLINHILTFFLMYAPMSRFSTYLVNHTDFYNSIIVPLLTTNTNEHFIQHVIDETTRLQTDSDERVLVFTHMISLVGEFVVHHNIDINACSFVSTFKQLFDALVDYGTTAPLWYLIKCLNNLLNESLKRSAMFLHEINRIGLIESLMNYTYVLIQRSICADGKIVLKDLHHNVLISCLSIFYIISLFDQQILDSDIIINKICRLLLKSNIQQIQLMSCLLYSNMLTPNELDYNDLCHHLSEQLFSSILQIFTNSNTCLNNHISLFSLLVCLKNLCTYKQIQIYVGQHKEHMDLLFRIVRHFNVLNKQQSEMEIILESIWFLSFEYSCALEIHNHDKYFALLVQLSETNSNDKIRQAATGILWQMKLTLSTDQSIYISTYSNLPKHIMLSYSHDSKDLVHRICQNLRKVGYRIWMNTDNMDGSPLRCVSHATEQSSIIIVCMTEKYKQSPDCQSEVEYAYRLKKPFIPILLQSKYKPDGWLGMLLGMKPYIDFTKNDFESNYKKLVKEIEAINACKE